jgi:hypothetical protein
MAKRPQGRQLGALKKAGRALPQDAMRAIRRRDGQTLWRLVGSVTAAAAIPEFAPQ